MSKWAWSPVIGQALFDICAEILDSVGDDSQNLYVWVPSWHEPDRIGGPDLLQRMRRAVDDAIADGHHNRQPPGNDPYV